MATMTVTDPNMVFTGLNLNAQVSISNELENSFSQKGLQKPMPISISAQIDTGASHCVIREDIPKRLGLQPVGAVPINTPSHHNTICYQYYLKLSIPYRGTFITYESLFTAVPLKGQAIDCLIGRDLLAHCVLIYVGYINQFTLSL